MTYEFSITREPTEAETSLLGQGLNRHAIENLRQDGFNPIAVFVRDEDGEIVGGVSGFLNWNWLQVSLLWVDSSLRGKGIGKQLMAKIETLGRENGCDNAHVDTFSFQAPSFYKSIGYEVFVTLDDYPPGHSRHYLKKAL